MQKQYVERGMVIARPGTMKPCARFGAQVSLFWKKKKRRRGGMTFSFSSFGIPQFLFVLLE